MKRHALHFLLLFALVTPSFSQDPTELTDLRDKYLEALTAIREPIKQKYVAKLDVMLSEMTRAGDLEKALEVRSAIEALKNDREVVATTDDPPEEVRPSRPDFGRPDFGRRVDPEAAPPGGTVVLNAADASLEGALKVYNGYIINWVRPNCRARWLKRDVPAGKYDIYFLYSADYGMGGTVEIKELSYSFDAAIRQTGYRDLDRVKVGSVETRGGISLDVTSKTSSRNGVMNLKQVQLVPTE